MNEKLLQLIDYHEERYPHALEKQYPRVLNKILELWGSREIDAYFTDLLVSDRPDRAGFPTEVASEIVYLSIVHSGQHDSDNSDVWGNVPDKLKQEMELQGISFTPAGFLKAAESGNSEFIAQFLSAKMNVDTCDERQWTALMISAFNGKEDMATLLIKCGADVHHRDNAGYTPLHWASFNGFFKVVKLLLGKHADVNARSNHGWTALLQAAARGHLSVASVLIENGADVNAATNDGWTPLHKAAANGNLAEVKLLLSKGADRSVKYTDGNTALDIATKNKHEDIVAVLSERE
jgi:uncharacterized protein